MIITTVTESTKTLFIFLSSAPPKTFLGWLRAAMMSYNSGQRAPHTNFFFFVGYFE